MKMDELLIKRLDELINSQLNIATAKLLLAIVVLYLLKLALDRIINDYFELRKGATSEHIKHTFQKKAAIFEHYFCAIYEIQSLLTTDIEDPSLIDKFNSLRPKKGDHYLYLERKEITLLNKLADTFLENQANKRYDIHTTSNIIQELRKCLKL